LVTGSGLAWGRAPVTIDSSMGMGGRPSSLRRRPEPCRPAARAADHRRANPRRAPPRRRCHPAAEGVARSWALRSRARWIAPDVLPPARGLKHPFRAARARDHGAGFEINPARRPSCARNEAGKIPGVERRPPACQKATPVPMQLREHVDCRLRPSSMPRTKNVHPAHNDGRREGNWHQFDQVWSIQSVQSKSGSIPGMRARRVCPPISTRRPAREPRPVQKRRSCRNSRNRAPSALASPVRSPCLRSAGARPDLADLRCMGPRCNRPAERLRAVGGPEKLWGSARIGAAAVPVKTHSCDPDGSPGGGSVSGSTSHAANRIDGAIHAGGVVHDLVIGTHDLRLVTVHIYDRVSCRRASAIVSSSRIAACNPYPVGEK